MNTYQRTREHGTIETIPGTPEIRIAAIRQVVTACQYAKIDGQMIDLFSAGAIVAVYDALSPENQAKFAALTAPKMARVAFRLLKKA